jgi:carboxyl-terminal processing protease
MITKSKYISILIISLVVVILSCGSDSLAADSHNPSDYVKELTPLKEHQRVTFEVIRELKKNHYKKVAIDDALSSKTFDRYLSDIDPSHMYFLASDIKEFGRYRYRLDDGLLKGDVHPAFMIFNRYQERLSQRLMLVINKIEGGLKDIPWKK